MQGHHGKGKHRQRQLSQLQCLFVEFFDEHIGVMYLTSDFSAMPARRTPGWSSVARVPRNGPRLPRSSSAGVRNVMTALGVAVWRRVWPRRVCRELPTSQLRHFSRQMGTLRRVLGRF